jgi:hypothetical protein
MLSTGVFSSYIRFVLAALRMQRVIVRTQVQPKEVFLKEYLELILLISSLFWVPLVNRERQID